MTHQHFKIICCQWEKYDPDFQKGTSKEGPFDSHGLPPGMGARETTFVRPRYPTARRSAGTIVNIEHEKIHCINQSFKESALWEERSLPLASQPSSDREVDSKRYMDYLHGFDSNPFFSVPSGLAR